jgi:hypothetical protein
MQIQRNTIMAKQQSRKPARHVNKLGTSGANQPPRKDEHEPRGRKPRTRSGRDAAETNSAAAAALPKATVENRALSITNDERPEKTALKPKPRSKGADTAPVSVSSPDLPRASTKRAMLIGMVERAQGASVAEIGQRLGWLPHTVRAAITGLRHAGRDVTRSKNESGQTVYRLAPVETQGR